MRVQLHTPSGTPLGDELSGQLPWHDFITWRGRVFRRAEDNGERRGHRLQHFHEVDVLDLNWDGPHEQS